MSVQKTDNLRVDGATRFWTDEDRDHSTPDNDRWKDMDDDVASAVREAKERSEEQDELEASRPHIETLRRGWGSLSNALESNLEIARSYRQDPITTRELHARMYLGRLPDVAPTPEPEEKPPADLTEAGLDEWHREHSVRKAMKNAGRDAEYRADLEKAAPLIKRVKKEYGPLRTSLEQAAAVHEAMNASPGNTATRLSYVAGAPATEAQAREYAQNAHAAMESERHRAHLTMGFQRIVASGQLPGIERADVQEKIAADLQSLYARGEGSGDLEFDLANAYNRVMASKPARSKRKSASAGEDDLAEIRAVASAAYRQHARA